MDLNTFDLTLGINVNLVSYLNKQPIRLITKCQSLNKSLVVVEFERVVVDESGLFVPTTNSSPVQSSDVDEEFVDAVSNLSL